MTRTNNTRCDWCQKIVDETFNMHVASPLVDESEYGSVIVDSLCEKCSDVYLEASK